MILHRYNKLINYLLFLFVFVMLFPNNSYASLANKELKYKIVEEQSNYYNSSKSNVTIDTKERVVTLKKDSYIPPDVIKFVDQDGKNEDFVVLTTQGLKYYAFDGEGYANINDLNVNIQNAYGVALNYSGDVPSYFISQIQPDGSGAIKHYVFDGTTSMIENSSMEITDTDMITSLATFTETNNGDSVGFSTKDAFKFNVNVDGNSYGQVTQVNELSTPLSIAAGKNGLNFAVLSNEKVERYLFDGSKFENVPALEIALSNETGKPRAVVIDDIDETTYILTDKEMMAYNFDGSGMYQNTSLSISSNKLKKPQAMTFNPSNDGMIIIDQENNGKYKGKYFMRDDTGSYTENTSIELNYFDDIVRTVSSTFASEGILHFGSFYTNADINLIRIRAYTDTPKNTKIKFQVSNKLNADGSPKWVDSWVI